MTEEGKTKDEQPILTENGISEPRKNSKNFQDDDNGDVGDENQIILTLGKTEEKTDERGDKKKGFRFRDFSKNEKMLMVVLALANFLHCCLYALAGPFFPQEAAKMGASKTVQGFIFSTFQLVILVTSPIIGKFITRLGPRRLFTTGIVVCGIGAILFGLLSRSPPGVTFIVLCFLFRGAQALGSSAYITASFAVICNQFPDNVAMAFGLLETANGLGLMLGPAIGGLLYELGGFGPPFYLLGFIFILCGAVAFKWCPFPQDVQVLKKSGYSHLLKGVAVWVGLICVVNTTLSVTFIDAFLATHLKEFHLSGSMIGFVFMVTGGLYAVASPVFGYLCDRLNCYAPFVVFGSLGCFVAYLFDGPSPLLPFLPVKLWMVVIGLAIQGISIGSVMIPAMKCVVAASRELGFEDNLDTFGIVAGLYTAAFCIGASVGPTAGGALTDHIGFRYTTTCISGLFLLTTVGCSLYFLYRPIAQRRGGKGAQHVPYEKIVSKGAEESTPRTELGQISYGSMENGHLSNGQP